MFKPFKLILTLFTAVMMMAGAARADVAQDATQMTDKIIAEVLALIAADQTEDEKTAELRKVLVTYGETETVARVILGATWRTASEAQQKAFSEAVMDYIAAKYSKQFGAYSGQAIVVTRAEDLDRKGILVYSVAKNDNGEDGIAIDWRYSDRSGSLKLVDIIVEGISLLVSEREAVGAMYEKTGDDLDKLITQLQG